jgi:hypothetical protein
MKPDVNSVHVKADSELLNERFTEADQAAGVSGL